MEYTKVQWHPGFVAAMNLEFAENREDLEFEKEYNLNTKPLEIDLLIIKKKASVPILNEIGSFFRGHNIMEYKSPEDHLDVDVFYKTMAYAALYKSYGKTLDEIKADDVTVTLIREAKPEGLFQNLRDRNFKLVRQYKGIYYVQGNVLFPVQIVVTGELNLKEHIWIGSLSQKMKKQDMQELFQRIQKLKSRIDQELADSVLQVSIEANRKMMEEWKGDDRMCQALFEIMEPEIRLIEKEREEAGWQKGLEKGMQEGMQQGMHQGMQQGIQQGIQQGMQEGIQQGIQRAIDMLRKLGYQEEKIKSSIMEGYQLSAEEAEKYF